MQEFSIALYNAFKRNFLERFKPIAINGDKFGLLGKSFNGSMHPKNRGVEDVETINFVHHYVDYLKTDCFGFNDFSEFVALLFRELFAICQKWMFEIIGKDNGCCSNGAGKTSSARFIRSAFKQMAIYF